MRRLVLPLAFWVLGVLVASAAWAGGTAGASGGAQGATAAGVVAGASVGASGSVAGSVAGASVGASGSVSEGVAGSAGAVAGTEPAKVVATRVADAAVVMPEELPTIGQEVEYRLVVKVPAGAQLDVPADLNLGDGAAISKERVSLVRKPEADGNEELTLTVPFVLVRAGRVKIPEVTLSLLLPNGTREAVRAGVVKMSTGTLFPNENNPEPSAQLSPVPVVETNWLLIWSLVVLGVVGLTVLVTLLVRKRFAKVLAKPAPPPRPAHEVAFQRLEQLDKEALPLKGEFMAFYVGLSEILREYLGSRWRFDSLDRTTTELMQLMRGKELKNYDFERLQYMLDDFDLVKFAKVVPTLESTDGDVGRVRKFVETTMVVESSGEVKP